MHPEQELSTMLELVPAPIGDDWKHTLVTGPGRMANIPVSFAPVAVPVFITINCHSHPNAAAHAYAHGWDTTHFGSSTKDTNSK
jgi:hypothetical protein